MQTCTWAPTTFAGTRVVKNNETEKRAAREMPTGDELTRLVTAYVSKLENLKNLLRNLLALPRGSQLGVLDMLEPFYNWVIPMDVIEGWMSRAGFADLLLLNELEPEKCAYHVLARKTADTASGR